VATLLRHMADEQRAANVPLSILFPFKASFYGRYGWATFCERRRYSGAPALFAPFKRGPGSFTQVGVEAIPELDRIYTLGLRGRFGLVVRDESWWRERVLHTWKGEPMHAFLWRDESAQARAYLIYRVTGEGDARRMSCREIVALDPEARAQLFGFIAGHRDHLAGVSFRAPADAPVNWLFPDHLECTAEPYFMLRLLDVPAALTALGVPREVGGRLSLAVHDDWLAENHGVYGLEFAEGKCAVERLPDTTPADLRCDVRVLAQLYSRLLRPRTAAAFGAIESSSRDGLELAERAFGGLAPYSSDFF
jgi:predicted acetyltransferase